MPRPPIAAKPDMISVSTPRNCTHGLVCRSISTDISPTPARPSLGYARAAAGSPGGMYGFMRGALARLVPEGERLVEVDLARAVAERMLRDADRPLGVLEHARERAGARLRL